MLIIQELKLLASPEQYPIVKPAIEVGASKAEDVPVHSRPGRNKMSKAHGKNIKDKLVYFKNSCRSAARGQWAVRYKRLRRMTGAPTFSSLINLHKVTMPSHA